MKPKRNYDATCIITWAIVFGNFILFGYTAFAVIVAMVQYLFK